MTDEFYNPDRLPCGLIVTDQDLNIIFVNNWIISETGFTGDINHKTHLSTIIQGINPLSETDTVISRQAHLLSKDGMLRNVHISIKTELIKGQKRTYIVVIPVSVSYQNELNDTDTGSDNFYGIVGKAPQMLEVYSLIEMAASTDANVVIQGESGTGKELVASAIHHASGRKDRPFVRVNCAALTETLLESELFGHVKGAFTGAYKDHAGKFEFADKGTILLDEIGEISQAMQVKLLRVLQERIVVRVGDNREISVDVRIVTATNKNLRSLVSKGKFREDLFYRLNVFPIHIPALRERRTDIALLVQHFIDKFNIRTHKHIKTCSIDAMRILMEYCWPGNVRELENTIEHAFVLCRGNEIQITDLPHELRAAAVRNGICEEKFAGIEQIYQVPALQLQKEISKLSISRKMIEDQISKNNGNKTAAARALGISKVGLWKKMKKLGMDL